MDDGVLAVFRRVVRAEEARDVCAAIRASGQKVVTFCGFSGAEYDDPVAVERLLRQLLSRLNPQTDCVCAGATADGIGMVYALAKSRGLRTIGIVSSLAEKEGVAMSDDVDTVYVVHDDCWGGRQGAGLSPTSEAMVAACDDMIGIGGGAIARDELDEARRRGKAVSFLPAEMNHARAIEKAAKAGKPPPADFRGLAHTLFHGPIDDKPKESP